MIPILIYLFSVITTPSVTPTPQQASPVTIPMTVMGQDTSLTLQDMAGEKGLVVVFYTPDCPYNNYYGQRLKAIKSDFFVKGFNFCIITSKDKQPTFLPNSPIFMDQDRAVTSLLGAHKTPEVFVFSQSYNALNVVYHGAIDDNPLDAGDVRTHYLRNALENILARKKQDSISTMPYGCYLK